MSDTIKHSDGGWRYDEGSALVLAADDQMTVAEMRGWGYLSSRHDPIDCQAIQDANGRLISAAPDLLAACHAALEEWGLLSCTAVQKLAKAVAKAEGRTEPNAITSVPASVPMP